MYGILLDPVTKSTVILEYLNPFACLSMSGLQNSRCTFICIPSFPAGRTEGNDSSSQTLGGGGGSSSQEMSMESIEEEEGTGQNSSSATSEGSGESFITSSSGAQLPQEMVRSASQESTGNF